ncbi:LPS biosynthesis protein [Pedosphaera parvula]|uniref:Lipopolysaccharide biosynthesis protein n=1 Tax=Pedosphaera parvula (strain Ellin514) TaxID=320771 RepID=B9XGI4_PEDPL|nr:LPS biosynthesis protein [Pedosphaera parvula]EEF61035.1 lipopolysaccharide biosynthesis protein [Pedosphaera parvula Ellin514]
MTTKHLSTLGLLLLVLGTAILGIGGYLLTLPEQYEATTRFRSVTDRSALSVDDSPHESYGGGYFIQTEFEVIQSELILNSAIEALHLRDTWAQRFHLPTPLKTSEARALLKHQLQLKPVANAQLIELTFTSHDPGEAAQIANAIADSYVHYEENVRVELTKAHLAELQHELVALDRQLADATNNVGHAETNPQAFAHLQKFRQKLASQIDGQTDHDMIGDKMGSFIDLAEPPTKPSGFIRSTAKILITLGIISQISGLLCFKQTRHQTFST